MIYEYSFNVWVDARYPAQVRELFKMYNEHRLCMEFSEEAFKEFRNALGSFGFELREIERIVYAIPETVL